MVAMSPPSWARLEGPTLLADQQEVGMPSLWIQRNSVEKIRIACELEVVLRGNAALERRKPADKLWRPRVKRRTYGLERYSS
jgi:hypothetical protein